METGKGISRIRFFCRRKPPPKVTFNHGGDFDTDIRETLVRCSNPNLPTGMPKPMGVDCTWRRWLA